MIFFTIKTLFCIFTLLKIILIEKVACRTSDNLKVTLPHGGVLIGRQLVSHKGRGIRAFMGVPYAQPPLGNLRFMPPIPAAEWNGERLSIQDSDLCIQRDPFRRDDQISGSEDCLYLNVYTPNSPDVLDDLPVMIFFHGGGWMCGSGISLFYPPQHLLDHDIIYIGVNYRLGPLGFLSTETPDCPGNNGLKDQVEALKWIKKNIRAFGGDPDNVTIFGESAGGASATYHMASALSKGLFHKAIAQSGTYLSPWAQPAHTGVAAKRAAKLGENLNCPQGRTNNWQGMLACLREKSAADVTEQIYEFFEWDADPMIPFPPVVEPKVEGAFLTEHPRDITIPISNGIPFLTGINSEEGAMKTAPLLNVPGLLEDFVENYDKALPIILNYDHHSPEIVEEITSKINNFYFKGDHRGQHWSKENHENLTNLLTDGWFGSGMDLYLKNRLSPPQKQSAGPTYVYLFEHKGPASFTEIFEGGPENYYGVCHAEELMYLFPIAQGLFVTANFDTKDVELQRNLTEMWVNFARTGNPTPTPDWPHEKWIEATEYPYSYVKIGSKEKLNWTLLKNDVGLFLEREQFWHSLKAHGLSIAASARDEL